MSKPQLLNILLAKVRSTKMPKVAKCDVNRLKLDTYVMKYYPKTRTVFARDTERMVKIGDIVLLKQLPEKVSNRVTHRVDRIIYSVGNVKDPVTGLKCDKDGYWDTRLEQQEGSDGVEESDRLQGNEFNEDNPTSLSVTNAVSKEQILSADGTPV